MVEREMSSALRYHHTLYSTALGTEDQEQERRRVVPLDDPDTETTVGSAGENVVTQHFLYV